MQKHDDREYICRTVNDKHLDIQIWYDSDIEDSETINEKYLNESCSFTKKNTIFNYHSCRTKVFWQWKYRTANMISCHFLMSFWSIFCHDIGWIMRRLASKESFEGSWHVIGIMRCWLYQNTFVKYNMTTDDIDCFDNKNTIVIIVIIILSSLSSSISLLSLQLLLLLHFFFFVHLNNSLEHIYYMQFD